MKLGKFAGKWGKTAEIRVKTCPGRVGDAKFGIYASNYIYIRSKKKTFEKK